MSNLTHGMASTSGLATDTTLDLIYDLLNDYAVRYAVKSDDANIYYYGQAPAGSAEGSAVWQIKRIDNTSGTIITWCDGDTNFNNIWSSRESLTYS